LRLILENGTVVSDPNDGELADALATLDCQHYNFAILERSGPIYIQVACNETEGFMLEFQEGDCDNHYQVTEQASLRQVVKAFKQYAHNELSWKADFTWKWLKL